MKKRRSKAGETLVETLVSVLIAALAFALLSTICGDRGADQRRRARTFPSAIPRSRERR